MIGKSKPFWIGLRNYRRKGENPQEEIVDDAQAEIDDAKAELEEGKLKAQEELDDAESTD